MYEEYTRMNLNINQMLKTGVNAITSNAPVILTAFGAVGVVGTAVLTAKATFIAADDIAVENEVRDEQGAEEMTTKETILLVWPHYVAPVTTGALSVAAIVMSHRISSKRAAVLAAAYALNEKRIEEYQDKVKEKFGVKKEKEARDEIKQKHVHDQVEAKQLIFSPLDGKVVIHEAYTDRFFYSSIDEINKAVNEANHEILKESSVRMSEFYDTLGLDHTSLSDHFGWNTDNRLEIEWSTCTTPDGKTPVHSFEYVIDPIMNPGSGSSFR
jgi:hypothetical protein